MEQEQTTEAGKHAAIRTPGEWDVFEGYDGHQTIATMRSTNRTVSIVAPRHAEPCGHQATDANAAFIVRACNAHDDLVAALQAWVAWFDRLDREADPGDPLTAARHKFHGDRINASRNAINKAGAFSR